MNYQRTRTPKKCRILRGSPLLLQQINFRSSLILEVALPILRWEDRRLAPEAALGRMFDLVGVPDSVDTPVETLAVDDVKAMLGLVVVILLALLCVP